MVERNTEAIVIRRRPINERAALVVLLTEKFGLVTARAEGLRRQKSKLSHTLQPMTLCRVTLIAGRSGWRLIGAVEIASYYFSPNQSTSMQVWPVAVSLFGRLLPPSEPVPEVFRVTKELLVNTTLSTANITALRYTVLHAAGYYPAEHTISEVLNMQPATIKHLEKDLQAALHQSQL